MTLFIVPTPIGNLKDITFRAIETLKECDLILAEDTRRTGILLKAYEISKPMISLHEHNEVGQTQKIIPLLKSGQKICIVSDGGTPLISDPGFKFVRECIRSGVEIVPLPGSNAAITSLTASGLPTDSFTFVGFLPKKQGKTKTLITEGVEEGRTLIAYESPYRIKKTIALFKEIIPNNPICICRELTKVHEEIIRGTPQEIEVKIGKRDLKGEITLIIGSQPIGEK